MGIGKFFSIFGSIFTGKAKGDVKKAFDFVGKALPIVTAVASVVVTVTPTPGDDKVWFEIREKYPTLFSGQQVSEDEIKLAALAYSADLLMKQNPGLTTSVARAAAQLAYIQFRDQQQITDK